SDLTTRAIILGAREPGAVLNPGEIIGKAALVPLYKGEQIRRERLGDPTVLDRPEVTVSVDPTRAGGVLPGDIADVYWVQSEAAPGALLAVDARVVSVGDANGVPIQKSGQGLAQLDQQVGQQSGPAMVRLSVKPEEVPQVIRGAIGKNVVLVKKNRETGGTVQPPSQQEEQAQGS
ncbi:MAG: hypothetical protein H5T99_13165, partial [Moorella sp. (in: Bacteria)]|nr:hypothetical protein [Moorella sp. (in: firmicutes)]